MKKSQSKQLQERIHKLMNEEFYSEDNLSWENNIIVDGYAALVESIVMPDKLYRYRPASQYTLDELKSEKESSCGSIYLASSNSFNDTYDSIPHFVEGQTLNWYAGMQEMLTNMAQTKPEVFRRMGEDPEEWLRGNVGTLDQQRVRIACFSEKKILFLCGIFMQVNIRGFA